jgi:PEP-CTERM motif
MIRLRRNPHALPAILSVAAVFGIARSAEAQVISLYSSNFNSPTYSNGVLNVGTDTTTPGQDGWLNTSGGGTNNITVSNAATNGFVSLTTNGQDVRRLFNGSQTVTSGSVWFQADIDVSAAQAAGDYAIHLSDGGTSNFNARVYFKSSGAGFVMAMPTGADTTPTYGTTVLTFGTTYTMLGRYDFVSGGTGNDTGALFINPTSFDGSADTPYVLATTAGIDATTIAAIALRQGTAANAPTLTVDNINVFTEAAVPEPSSLALLGIAALAPLARRWKRPSPV